MKIISKFKDYYDWVVFETDHRKVYLRDTKDAVFSDNHYHLNEKTINPRTHVFFNFKKERLSLGRVPHYDGWGYHMVCMYFCGEIYIGLYNLHSGKYYWDIDNLPPEDLKKIQKDKSKNYWWGYGYRYWDKENLGLLVDEKTKKPIQVELNKQLNSPVVLSDHRGLKVNPNMAQIDFKLIPPERAYQEIYNFVEYKEPENLPGSPTDMARYEGKGFDSKTSFRPKMK